MSDFPDALYGQGVFLNLRVIRWCRLIASPSKRSHFDAFRVSVCAACCVVHLTLSPTAIVSVCIVLALQIIHLAW